MLLNSLQYYYLYTPISSFIYNNYYNPYNLCNGLLLIIIINCA